MNILSPTSFQIRILIFVCSHVCKNNKFQAFSTIAPERILEDINWEDTRGRLFHRNDSLSLIFNRPKYFDLIIDCIICHVWSHFMPSINKCNRKCQISSLFYPLKFIKIYWKYYCSEKDFNFRELAERRSMVENFQIQFPWS